MAVLAEDVFRALLTPEQLVESDRRAEELIAEYRSLQQLRKARDLTQVELAQRLGKDQVSISQMEKRADMLLSTLRNYVEAMGGELDLVVRFKDGPAMSLAGLSTETVRAKAPVKP